MLRRPRAPSHARSLLATLLLTALSIGCTAADPATSSQAALDEAPRLVALGTRQGTGPDAREVTRVAFAHRDGRMETVPHEAIGFVPRWRGGAALVTPARRLLEVRPGGAARMLAEEVVGPLAADPQQRRLAYTTERGFLTHVLVHDGRQPARWAEGLAGAGALRFDGNRLLYVGAPPGGVVGLWEARADGPPRCLTNCGLRTGTDWGDRFVPPPGRAEDIEPDLASVRWTDAAGEAHEVAR